MIAENYPVCSGCEAAMGPLGGVFPMRNFYVERGGGLDLEGVNAGVIHLEGTHDGGAAGAAENKLPIAVEGEFAVLLGDIEFGSAPAPVFDGGGG